MITLSCTPKARLVFRVGVTGHRPDKLYANASKRVVGKVSTLLTEIQMVARRIIDDAPGSPGSYDSRKPVVRLVSLWRRERIVWRWK